MSALHTPGPWVVGRELNSERPGSIPIEAASHESLGGKMHVAFVNGKAGEQEANARLIASAPALLAACEAALDFVAAAIKVGQSGPPTLATDTPRQAALKAEQRFPAPYVIDSQLRAALRLARGS